MIPWILVLAVQASPYAGEQARDVKALSAEDTGQLLAGHGMGLARAAELNHFPGPRHALQLGAELGLRPEQQAALEDATRRMHEAAVRLGRAIVEREGELDALFARGEASAERVRELTAEIGRLQGELRAAHLVAHVETRGALDAAQVAAYDRLRGYATP